jgi:uncharacterized membrane protein YsdA (DUF1294 family)
MNIKTRSLLFYGALSGGVGYGIHKLTGLHPIFCWFGGVNTVLFLVMAKDKAAATTGLRRTPESTLLLLAAAGGFPGLFAGRHLFNHKTSKVRFNTLMWLLFVAELAAAGWWFSDLERFGFEKKPPAEQQMSEKSPPLTP